MTGNDIPSDPSVLNTTVLSNFAYIDQLWVVAGLSGICAVPIVREELENGVDDHPYLQNQRNPSYPSLLYYLNSLLSIQFFPGEISPCTYLSTKGAPEYSTCSPIW